MTADDAGRPPIVVRDNRRIDAGGSARNSGSDRSPGGASGVAGKSAKPEAEPAKPEAEPAEKRQDAVAADPEVVEVASPAAEEVTAAEAESTAPVEPEAGAEPSTEGVESLESEAGVVFAELSALRSDLDELTRDLQRVTAEYANYRKRVDRDRAQVQEQATGSVLGALLPALDDLDRARSHGDLVGPFAAVADQLTAALSKFGLTPFGEPGDPFDPTLHEAVSHASSPDVTETTCVEVMRRGYLLGERLLRPALVGVADPE